MSAFPHLHTDRAELMAARVSPEFIKRSKQAAWDIYCVRQISNPLGNAKALYDADMALIEELGRG